MDALLLRCPEGVRFHLGATSLEDSSELLHADTLFSALANVYALAYDAAGEWVDHVREGRVRFSSGLHCAELSWRPEPIFFVPRPPLRYSAAGADLARAKALRRIRYVSPGVLAEIGSHLDLPASADDVPACTLDLLALPRIGGAYACTPAELAPVEPRDLPSDPLHATLSLPRVEVRTQKLEDTFYHAAGLAFMPVRLAGGHTIRGHFYVLVEHSLDAEAWRRLLACFRLLADEGVGGERTCGYGWFEDVRVASVPLPGSEAGGAAYLSVSPVIPADDAELERALHYELFLRGGGSLGAAGEPKLHRRRVRAMREGALFRGGPARGRLVDVSPEDNPLPHRLLRCGIGFTLPLGSPA